MVCGGVDFCCFPWRCWSAAESPLARNIFKEKNLKYGKPVSDSQKQLGVYDMHVPGVDIASGYCLTRKWLENCTVLLCQPQVNIVSLDVIWVWKEKSSKMKCRIQQNRYKKKASSLPLRGKRFPFPSCWIHSDMGKCTPCLLQEAFAVACGTHLQWFVENTYINLVSSKCTAVIISFLFVWNTFNKINLFLFLPLPSLQAVHYFCLFIWVNDNLATTWTSI